MAEFHVNTEAQLSKAITASKNNGKADTINITGDITLTKLLPLIEEDVQLTINGGDNTIDGNNQHRLFFVRSGVVNFDDLIFSNGRAQGGDGNGGAAGLGGAMFVYDGKVKVTGRATLWFQTAALTAIALVVALARTPAKVWGAPFSPCTPSPIGTGTTRACPTPCRP